MNVRKYIDARRRNQDIIRNCLATKSVNFSDIMFWEGISARDLSFDEVASKWADILACTVIGALPCVGKHGADGYLQYTGSKDFVPVETKLCGVRHEDLAVGPRGGLYYSTNLDNWYSKCSITSHFSGKFDASMSRGTMQSKNRDTFLVLFDRTENCIIDTYGMEGKKVLELLEEKKNNSSITFKLSAFFHSGFAMTSGFGKFEGFDAWEERVIKKTTRRIMD